jgi:hypothetical protein
MPGLRGSGAGRRPGAPVRLAALSGSAEAAYPVTFTSTAGQSALPSTAANADVATAGQIWPYYTDIGISSDGQSIPSGYDGSSYTYSANALAADGLTPGAAVTSNGVSYTWPDAPAGQPDSINAAGQTIPVSFPAGTTTIGLLGSAIDAGASGAGGTLTVTYTDGTTQQIPVAFSDWTLGAGAYQLLPSDTNVATIAYRDTIDGTSQPVPTHVYATSAALDSGKTVASVTLPIASGGSIGIFAIGAG